MCVSQAPFDAGDTSVNKPEKSPHFHGASVLMCRRQALNKETNVSDGDECSEEKYSTVGDRVWWMEMGLLIYRVIRKVFLTT